MIFQLGLHWKDKPGENINEDEIQAREGRLNRIRYMMGELDVSVLENAALTCTADTFMETLINNVRNETCSYQAFYIAETKRYFLEGLKKLQTLKRNFEDNADQISTLEKHLNEYADNEMRTELESFPVFEYLEAEKMRPKFLALAKNTSPDPDLSVIKDNTGTDFLTEQNLKDFITSYFSGIYAETPGRTNPHEVVFQTF
jgi:hypothetical protein